MNDPITSLFSDMERHAVTAERHGDRLRLRAPKRPPDDLLAVIRASKSALLAVLPDADVRPVLHFRLPSHAPNAWATYLGQAGQSIEAATDSLRERLPCVVVLASMQSRSTRLGSP